MQIKDFETSQRQISSQTMKPSFIAVESSLLLTLPVTQKVLKLSHRERPHYEKQ